jgi:cell division control protein 45
VPLDQMFAALITSTLDHLSIYVIDSHRPYHIDNIVSKNVFLLGQQTADDLPGYQAAAQALAAYDSDEYDSTDENDDDTNTNNIDIDGDDDDDSTDGELLQPAAKRSRTQTAQDIVAKHERLHRSKLQRKRQADIIAEYYKSSYYGVSAAMLMYPLAAELTRRTYDLLW